MADTLPAKFTQAIMGLDAEAGQKWLADLPLIIEEIAEKWSLTVGDFYLNLSYHYVAPCLCEDGGEAVLKIGFPGESRTSFNEAKMLEFIDGNGLVKLLKFDGERCALLLEKLTQGENLKTICRNDEAQAIRIAIKIMRELWRKPPEDNSFQKLEDWFKGFERAEKTTFNGDYLKKARRFYEELSGLHSQKILLHGDLHHENILSAKREPFLAIDPKGIIGEAGYETSTFLINHAKWLASAPGLKEKLETAINIFSDGSEIEPQEIRKWAYAQSVLSAWWAFEENSENWRDELAFAEIWEV